MPIAREIAVMEPQENPYQSPATDVGGHPVPEAFAFSVPPYKLYSIGSILLAAFLGSIVAGGVLMAINYVRLRRGTAAIHAVLWPTVVLVLLLGASFVLPDELDVLPGPIVLGAQLVGMYYAAKGLQGDDIESHQRAGGRLASNWAAAGIAIVTVVALVVIIAIPVTIAVFIVG